MDITKNPDGKISINNIDYVPIYMYKNTNLKLRKMKVLDIEKSISNYENGIDTSISQSTYVILKKELNYINKTLND